MTIVLFYHDTSPVLSLYFSMPHWMLDDLKHGTEQDKANLPLELNHNKSHQQHGCTKPQADRRWVQQHLNSTSRCARHQDNGDEGELPDLQDSLMPAVIAHLQQIEAEVATEEAQAQQQQQNQAGRANCFGIAQADGTTVHVGPRFPLQDWHHCMILARAFWLF